MRPPTNRAVAAVLLSLALGSLLLSACMYSFRAGAGFPDHVKTVAVLPFDLGPTVTRPELTDERKRDQRPQERL